MFPKILSTQFFLAVFPFVLAVFFYTANGQSQSPCFWSKCFLSGNSGSPCPNEYTNTTSKTCFWGTGTMYQCCKIEHTSPSPTEPAEGSTSTEAFTGTSESSYTTESMVQVQPETTIGSSETPTTTTPDPINLLQCEMVKAKQYPFIVALMEQRDGKTIHFCSGAIVNEWFVITSASCVADKLTSTIDASAANLNLTYFESTEQTIMVRSIHIHMDFNSGDPTRKSDLALLEMEHPFKMWSEYVHPIRIAPNASFVDEPGNSGTVVGWEIQDLNGSGSSALDKIDIPFVTRGECAELYKDLVEPIGQDKIDIEKQFCASSSQTHKECAEDYGSPVITRTTDGTRYIVGISSVHSNSMQVPNVYTDITYFRDYIVSVILSRK